MSEQKEHGGKPMSHWKKPDHLAFLLMLIPMSVLFFFPLTVFNFGCGIALWILWWVAFIYDVYESIKRVQMKKTGNLNELVIPKGYKVFVPKSTYAEIKKTDGTVLVRIENPDCMEIKKEKEENL